MIEITSVSSNEIVLKYMIVYHEVINIIQMIEDKMNTIEQEEPSLKTSAILHVSKVRDIHNINICMFIIFSFQTNNYDKSWQ